jgi:hypothetical protein
VIFSYIILGGTDLALLVFFCMHQHTHFELMFRRAITTLGPQGIINILKPLAEATNCGGIVKWVKLSQDTDVATAFLRFLGIH